MSPAVRRRVAKALADLLAPVVHRLVADELAAARVSQTHDVWQRFKFYRADGNLVGIRPAMNEVYLRTARIEAKLDRLLAGSAAPGPAGARTTGGAEAPATRTFTLALPAVPAGSTAKAAGPSTLEMTAHWSMFVPQKLASVGFGGYERAALPHFMAALETAGAGAFLDIGLNVGPYSLLARRFSDREVVGFEPTPDLAEVARGIGKDNGLDYTVEELALGAEDGVATLYLSDASDSSNSLDPTFRASTYTLEVPLLRLDEYLARTGTRPAVIKVDTETTEPAVLAGAVNTVKQHRPWFLVEVLPGKTERALETVVGDWGYTWYHLDGPGPLPVRDAIVGDRSMENIMWLLTPEPVPDEYWGRVAGWAEALAVTAT